MTDNLTPPWRAILPWTIDPYSTTSFGENEDMWWHRRAWSDPALDETFYLIEFMTKDDRRTRGRERSHDLARIESVFHQLTHDFEHTIREYRKVYSDDGYPHEFPRAPWPGEE